jgi:esterase/lipase superfamily enzyme
VDLETIKRYDDSWWLEYLRRNTVFDADNIKAQKDWLVKQAEKAKQVEMILCCGDYDNQSKLDNINALFFDE